MSYRRSAARNSFDSNVLSLSSDVSAVKRYKKIKPNIKQCVLRNAIFQASAALEDYLFDLCGSWINSLTSNGATVAQLPKNLIAWAIGKNQIKIFENYILSKSESKLIADIKSMEKLGKYLDNNSALTGLIHYAEFVSDKKYPSEKNIITLFKRFGIEDIFSTMNARGKKDYKSILKSFSDVRTEIAHAFSNMTFSVDDVIGYLNKLKDFVKCLDRVFYFHVKGIGGHTYWKT